MLVGCVDDFKVPEPVVPFIRVPDGFPNPEFPAENQYTDERWKLGKLLFYDPILSRDSTVSCNSCHMLERAFTDGLKTSVGIDQKTGKRNAPSLANVAYHPYFTREGGVPTLEMQVLVPIQEHDEFDFNILKIGERLRRIESYRELSEQAYGREPDFFVIPRAIATFERSLLSGNSRYDQHQFQKKADILTEEETRGLNLFFGAKANCASCHGGFNFTDYSFQNNGLYEEYEDIGRLRFTGKEEDRGLFKVPSLRNVEVTAPYMHDGSINTLTEVVEHYSKGGFNNPQQSEQVKPIYLSKEEKEDLVAFLKALTDDEFLTNQLLK